jgi:hypothetical protein
VSIERHADHPPETICRPAGNGLCEPLIPSKVPDLTGVPWGELGGEGWAPFSSAI